MKKILLAIMFFSLIFATTGVLFAEGGPVRTNSEKPNNNLASSTRPSAEKIANPNEIKFFERIEKIGTALWGMRKNIEKKPEINKLEDKKINNANSTSTKTEIEKIANPNEIKFFERIEKIGNALWGIRKENAKKEKSQKPMEPRPFVVKPVAVQCVKDAIDKKDGAVKNSLNTHNESQISAITDRNTCQKAALDKSTGPEQFEANKLCVNVFKTSMQGANELLKKSQNESWEMYKKDLKTCSELQKETKATSTATTSSNEKTGEIMINDGNEEGPEIK